MTSQRELHFGVNLYVPTDRDGWVAKCRDAERSGYDVISVADHVGLPPCFPALVLAAENTERVRLNTLVLNAAFYYPGLLVREVTGTDQFTGGRLELGLGAGYAKFEFDAAGVPWLPAGRRIDHLERTIVELKKSYDDPAFSPRPAQQPGPPLLIGGRGDRLLTLAAQHADIIGFNGAAPVADGEIPAVEDGARIAERVQFVRDQLARLGRDASEVELNVLLHWVEITDDRDEVLDRAQELMPNLTREQIAENPTVMIGTAAEIAERVHEVRERYGFTYFTVLEQHSTAFAEALKILKA